MAEHGLSTGELLKRAARHGQMLREALAETEPEGGEGAIEEGSPQDVLRSAAYRLLTTVDLLTVDVEDPGEGECQTPGVR
ncbi:hypothetical protein D9753_21025 [Streptomyces dangxiongensis]|uniref:Uncharacterized protein n=1 Tax=Streptomyces dangxiongensis TaxID=1442032 RepID=A0A3G2JK49_9ACTN|nr:hypothetical protein [Streptomyces dangxiongensis]AYN40949.1 hypothetical protein D9753_21025 [Streptomyces dangxiongensis]